MTDLAKQSADATLGGRSFDVSSVAFRQKKRTMSRQMLADIMMVYDISAVFLSGVVAQYFYYMVSRETLSPDFDYLSLMCLVAISFHFMARQNKLYDTDKITVFIPQLSPLISACVGTFAVTFVVLFFVKASDHYSRIWFVQWSAFFLVLLALGRGILTREFDGLARKGSLRRSVALVGSGMQFEAAAKFLQSDERIFRMTRVLDTAHVDLASQEECSAAFAEFVREARACDIDEIMIALPAGQSAAIDTIVRQIQTLPVDVHILPDFGGVKIPFTQLRQAGDLPVITTISKPISGWGALFKNIEDYFLAAVGVVLALPAMILIALAIKLDSRGPVLFRQRRHGYNNLEIEVLKFRSMRVMEDGDVVTQAKRNDKRVTRVGRILRRTSLDELPQLFNVLRGEMSIVGPRPHALAHNTYYGGLVESYANRHRVKPGITGWAQVHGFRGETENPQMMEARVAYDLDYIDNWSIWLDIKIIIMTPFFGIFRKGAY